MKYLYLLFLLFSLRVLGQQKGLNYQAVILDPNTIEIPGQVIAGQPLSKGKVWVRFTLISQAGIDYEEVHQTQTDEFGLVNLIIGAGNSTVTLGTNASSGTVRYSQFDSIVWDEKLKRLQVSVNFTGTGNYTEVSNQLMTFSPYSLYAASVDYKNVRDSPTNLSQYKNDVGYLIPKDLDPIKKDMGTALTGVQENSAKIEANQSANKTRFGIIDQSISGLTSRLEQQADDMMQVNTTLHDYDVRIQQNSSQIQSTVSSMQGQIGSLQSQLNVTQSTVANLSGTYENMVNKSAAIDLGNSNPSNSLYPTQRAVKSYVDNAMSMVISNGVPDATTLATGKIQLAGDLAGTATTPTVPGLVQKESLLNKSTDLVADAGSNAKYPSVKAVKDYVDQATSGIASQTSLNNKADLNSPVFSGTPSLPTGTTGVTQTSGNNSTALATTAYVQTAMASATVVDANTTTKGKIQLAGDLGGSGTTAAAPVISDNAISTAKIANGAVTDAKFFGSLTVGKGGTGATTLTGMLKGNGTNAVSQATINMDYSLVRFVSDEYTVVTAGQTSFTLTQTPNVNSTIRLFINGVRISKTALSVSGTILTYNPTNNGAATLVVGDRIQVDYYY